jgi:formylglycine-generating enzyme required for sulfatase activity
MLNLPCKPIRRRDSDRGLGPAVRAAAAVGFLTTVVAATAWADPPEKRLSLPLDHDQKLEFVWIEPGRFRMGSPDSDALAYETEKPLREVRIEKGATRFAATLA